MTSSEAHQKRAALSSHRADMRAEQLYGEKVETLRKATLALRTGEITQETWLAIHRSILGYDFRISVPEGWTTKEPSIREYPENP